MKFLQVGMLDQSKWVVPVDVIARNRANGDKEIIDIPEAGEEK